MNVCRQLHLPPQLYAYMHICIVHTLTAILSSISGIYSVYFVCIVSPFIFHCLVIVLSSLLSVDINYYDGVFVFMCTPRCIHTHFSTINFFELSIPLLLRLFHAILHYDVVGILYCEIAMLNLIYLLGSTERVCVCVFEVFAKSGIINTRIAHMRNGSLSLFLLFLNLIFVLFPFANKWHAMCSIFPVYCLYLLLSLCVKRDFCFAK